MDSKIYKQIKEEYAEKRRKAQQTADERRFEVYSKAPEVKAFDNEMLYLARTLIGAGDKAYEKLERIKGITEKRAKTLEALGYPADYTNPPYECTECNDTGYSGTEMCKCMKMRIRFESLKESGLGKLAQVQSFDNFSLSYYSGTARDAAERNMKTIRGFADSFSKDSSENFLLIGGTGLGKTHLSTSLAKAVIEKGFDVVYTSVINMFDDFEKKRFSSQSYEKNEHLTDRYFNCDLLIIDDLGCEMGTQFTVSALYTLVNTRLNDGKPMLINTNLSPDEFQKRYDNRITSRILGNFTPLLFKGEDIRLQKLMK